MSWGKGSSFAAAVAGLLILALALLVPTASAAPVLKAGTSAETSGGFCAPSLITPSYSQQVAGIDPKVNDVFYISLRIDLSLITFDCANEFYSVLADLPPNVSPAAAGGTTMICRRWGLNAGGAQVFDQRAATNCPTSLSVNGSGEFSMRPKSAPVLPDVGGSGGSYWFAGIRSPQESQTYDHVQLLVPVKASAAMAGQPVSFLVCGTGSSCETASVSLTVTGAPAQAEPPLVSIGTDLQVSAVGARIPFTINDVTAGSSYYTRTDLGTVANFTSGRACGQTDSTYWAAGTGTPPPPFVGSDSLEMQFGDLEIGGATCYLVPDTLYFFKVCSLNSATFAELHCQNTSFRTGSVSVTLELPVAPPFSVNPTAAVRVLGGHPAGTIKVQRKPKASGSFTDVTNPTGMVQSSSDSAIASQPFTSALDSWRSYEVRACFIAGAHQPCSTPVDYTTGHATTGVAMDVAHNSATLTGTPSAPNPGLTMSALISTTDPGNQDPRVVMTSQGSGAIASNNSMTQNSPVSAAVSNLQPETLYYWTACFENDDAGPLIEDCGEVKTFTTGSVPDPCTVNPNLPECQPDFCEINPTDPSCTPDPCDDTPQPAQCNPSPTPSLTFGKVKAVKVKRGKTVTVKVPVKNGSVVAAQKVKVCPSLAARFKGRLKLPRCKSPGTVAAGKTVTVALFVKAPGKAKAGVVTLKLALSWTGGSRAGSAKVTIRK